MKNINLKKADFSDIEFLWYLRNQPDIYKYFKKAQPISWRKHVKWIMPILSEKRDKQLFIIRILKTPIGQIRFDYKNRQEAEISISVLKQFRGKGFAAKALKIAIKWFKKNNKEVKILFADVFENNLPSRKLFEKVGFKLKTKKGKLLKYFFNYGQKNKIKF